MNKFHDLAKSKGWWDEERISSTPDYLDGGAVFAKVPEKLCLIHSEVSEALESYRDGECVLHYDEKGKPLGIASELADIVIRTYDLAGALGIDLDGVIDTKHAFNTQRPHRHGGKRC